MKNKLLFLFVIVAILSLLSACATNSTSGKQDGKHVKIGVNAADGPVWEVMIEKAKEKGIEIELVELADYTLPNDALVNGEIDMNSFQHLAFLSQYNVQNDANLVPIGSTTIGPKGLYSEKYQEPSEIPNGSTIAISNDPANLGLDLNLLKGAGLIELKEDAGIYGTLNDITKNPKNLDIVPMQSQQTARVMKDVAASAIYSSSAGRAGYSLKDAIYQNDPISDEGKPYMCVFAVRAEDKQNETYKKIAELYQDPEVKKAVEKDSNGISTVKDIPVEELQKTLNKLMENAKKSE